MMRVTLAPSIQCAGARLDDLLASRFLARREPGRIRSVAGLPPRLEDCVRNLADDSEWRAYGGIHRTFLAIARTHVAESRLPPSVAIDVYFLDENAAVYSAGVWDYDCQHGWWLDSVIDASYDCDHGWWLGALMKPIARAS
jgi:hypothetical protein